MTDTKANQIAAARRALADRKAADPAAIDRYEARMARLTAAAKRERERVAHVVLGQPRPAVVPVRPAGLSRQEWKIEKERQRRAGARLSPGIEEAVQLREDWAHKQAGTPETWQAAERTHSGALAQLHANGTIDNEQLEYAAEIANVHRSIEADVSVAVASLEARVDQSRSSAGQVPERIYRVRMHHAYTLWRAALPVPRQLVLDMIVGDAIGYTVAARRYGVHKRKARRLLLDALDRWPHCVDQAHRAVDEDMLDALNAE